ncbi:phosphate acyltransferase, partial [Mycoplasmopsis bovis]
FDSAYDLNVRKAKFPSAVQKEAGVFIFPNLESCNIGCIKLHFTINYI